MKLSLTHKLLIDIEQSAITERDLKRAGQHVLDWIACSGLGRLSPAGDSYAALLALNGQSNSNNELPCTAIGEGKANWQDAIQYNGALGNVLEMDDIHRSSILHPGPVVIPAALAIAEQFDCSIQDFLTAIIKGYELTIWLGKMIGRSHYKYFHNTATCGALGAALAASSLLKLDFKQTLWALGNAGSRTGGLWQMRNEKVLTKQWHNAESARSGAMAAVLASKGLSGPEFILEGPQGIFNAMSSDSAQDYFCRKNKCRWRMFECSFKPWPACRHAHPAMDSLITLWQENSLSVDQVNHIQVGVYQDAKVFCDNPTPETELQAKFSIQHALTAILLWGTPKLEHYQMSSVNDERAIKMRDKIQLIVLPSIEAEYPQHFGAQCTVTLTSGQEIMLALKDTLGDPERPLNDQKLKSKATMLLAKAGMSEENIQALCGFDWLANQSLTALTSLLAFDQEAER